jgi:hypothetical protein
MAYRKKADFILAHKPDIVIVPECECPDKLKFINDTPIPNDIYWSGSNQNKGLGVFSYGNYTFKLLDNYNPDLKTILPLAVTGGAFDFTLFAIWANNPQDKNYQYIGQVWKAIQHYDSLLKNERTILMGDFNSNTIWDKPKRREIILPSLNAWNKKAYTAPITNILIKHKAKKNIRLCSCIAIKINLII